jgi:D-arabinose 1-dehydrogenase-like Zn-dependent alcohol dehydrogenase
MTTARAGELPGTMRTSVLTQPGRLELQERPVPRPDAQDVLIAVRSVGIAPCSSPVPARSA